MDDMFVRELLLEYYHSSKHRGALEHADLTGRATNPVCVGPTHQTGDSVVVQVKLNGHTIQSIKFTGSGCTMSQAAASVTLDLAEGKTTEKAKLLSVKDIEEVLGMTLTPSRMQCAELALRALKSAIRVHENPEDALPPQKGTCQQ